MHARTLSLLVVEGYQVQISRIALPRLRSLLPFSTPFALDSIPRRCLGGHALAARDLLARQPTAPHPAAGPGPT